VGGHAAGGGGGGPGHVPVGHLATLARVQHNHPDYALVGAL